MPAPGRYRELFALVSRLHSTLLDRSRPLWELHLIEGLASKQLAVYLKMHHAAIDGVGSMQLTQALCSPDPAYRSSEFVLSQRAYERYLRSVKAVHPQADGPKEGELRAVAEALKQTFDSSAHLFNALRRFGGAFFDRSGNLAVPWHNVPRTSINTRVGGARRFVAQSWDFDRVKSRLVHMTEHLRQDLADTKSGWAQSLRGEMKPRHAKRIAQPISNCKPCNPQCFSGYWVNGLRHSRWPSGPASTLLATSSWPS